MYLTALCSTNYILLQFFPYKTTKVLKKEKKEKEKKDMRHVATGGALSEIQKWNSEGFEFRNI